MTIGAADSKVEIFLGQYSEDCGGLHVMTDGHTEQIDTANRSYIQ
jgi:hypothetical protein